MTKALVLAGGESSRMGTDKALVIWNGLPMLELVCRSAWGCCEDVSVLTPWPDRYREKVPSVSRWIEESRPGRGPLLALAEGWEKILMLASRQGDDTEWLLLLGCDLPLLQPEILRQWASQLPSLPPNILALVPQKEGRWEPLCGFYRRPAWEHLKEFILLPPSPSLPVSESPRLRVSESPSLRVSESPRLRVSPSPRPPLRPSLQKWLGLLPVQPLILAEREARMLLNCNRPSDLPPNP
ncbi:MAG TPA: molybdenum cofactor guanylyltransferase [Oscillatoriaceae cyanobacterium M33_DOE_052]|uniref:Molybdenum cofactor guanylyltransferase n=1 Tax=Planktothricoides sp. SpSt-374 TaxID=2282167 RepID=A0A7C3VEY3_9CYAN|nr:molybdenum cofactor guanylyltransferase [Oscillatoriaceae cyanobacterium M33_DOE_052]